ncbi:eabc4793-53a4-4d2d-a096-efb746da3534 [Thermothielavioides terrestris]|uniref:Uncharacterized protein n=2 Tax=Thermothielavioides terrestris TaxID=2587410 RepID=G2QXT2_THETT|nr:uncharacterized protein THITE_2169385 [Thermothielavioides terrestris NRRL 8126]AEO63200.1 hypothetical protein THITE_2169385 [Thermothielavioides terrestris NRRL 8126]SPQ21309.1 eabc4793-53a4-4d2d-a096-efb746da3534 [Thermothielavioides terrestris]
MSASSSRPPQVPYPGSPSSSSSSSSSSSASSSSYSASDSDLPSSNSASSGSLVRLSMDSTTRPPVQVTVIRCLRCARGEEITSTDDPSLSGMIKIGTNIYYCSRCAKMVGYT